MRYAKASSTINGMKKLTQRGSSAGLLVAFVLLVMLLVGAIGFGVWAYSSQQDYKNNTDQKIEQAVVGAGKKMAAAKDKEFAEQLKKPLDTYKGPNTYGGVTIKYPKSWSAYVVEAGDSSNPIDGYFHPNYVPGVESKSSFALRVQVTSTSYTEETSQYEDKIAEGKVKITAFRAAKVKRQLGIRINGEIDVDKQGSMVILPMRDKTLKIWTESPQFISDFDKYILPNLSFSP